MSENVVSVADEVIEAFGGVSKAAKALGHKHVTTVDGWKRTGRIPPWRRREIIEAAERQGVTLPTEFISPPEDRAA